MNFNESYAKLTDEDIENGLSAYDKIVQIILDKSVIIKKPKKKLNNREKIWKSLADEFYVIGDNFDNFKKEATKQGFINLVTYLQIYRSDKAFEQLDQKNQKYLLKWLEGSPVNKLSHIGCHVSHSIVSGIMLSDRAERGLIFENDCMFEYFLSDNLILEISNWINENNPEYLSLGTWEFNDKTSLFYGDIVNTLKNIDQLSNTNFYIRNNPSWMAHSYIINKKIAQKMRDSIDIEIPKHEHTKHKISLSDYYYSEYSYRVGGDDFFIGFTKQFAIYPSLTYQGFLGSNVYARPRNKKDHQCKICQFECNKLQSYILHMKTNHKSFFDKDNGIDKKYITYEILKKKYVCSKCIFGCNKEKNYEKHLLTHETLNQ